MSNDVVPTAIMPEPQPEPARSGTDPDEVVAAIRALSELTAAGVEVDGALRSPNRHGSSTATSTTRARSSPARTTTPPRQQWSSGPSRPPPRQRGARPMTRAVEAAAGEVAAAYADTRPSPDPLVAAAFARLVTESDRLFRHITAPDRPDGVHIAFTECPAPYADADELIIAVMRDRVLEVTTVAKDSRSPAPRDGQRSRRRLRPVPRCARRSRARPPPPGFRPRR